MQLLVINNIDFTKYVNESTYKINRESVYEEWTDANGRIHRTEYRTRISGGFDLCFVTKADYDDFLDAVRAASTNKLLTATLYVGGDVNDNVTTNLYYELGSSRIAKINANYIFNRVSMELKEW